MDLRKDETTIAALKAKGQAPISLEQGERLGKELGSVSPQHTISVPSWYCSAEFVLNHNCYFNPFDLIVCFGWIYSALASKVFCRSCVKYLECSAKEQQVDYNHPQKIFHLYFSDSEWGLQNYSIKQKSLFVSQGLKNVFDESIKIVLNPAGSSKSGKERGCKII